jgi:LysM repeat protein
MSAIRTRPGLLPAPPRVSRRRFLWRSGLIATAAVVGFDATVAPALAASGSYQVQPGDTLWGIADHFGISVDQLAALNGLTDPNLLWVGQSLVINPNLPPPILSAPYHSQFDGTPYADSNCGPTTLSMALGALNINVDQITLRHLAARQMGFDNPADGVTWEALAYAARAAGATVSWLYQGNQYRTWSIADLKHQFAAGHPVVLLVRYWDLPDHLTATYGGDHYIAALGFDASGNLVYNDPAFHVGSGADRAIGQSELMTAWTDTSVRLIRTAMALS